MSSYRNTTTARQRTAAALPLITERLAWFGATGVIIFFSLALLSHLLLSSEAQKQPSLSSLLSIYGGGYGMVLLYLRQRRPLYLWLAALVFCAGYLIDHFLTQPWGLAYLTPLTPLQHLLSPSIYCVSLFLLLYVLLTVPLRQYQQHKRQKKHQLNELQHYRQLTPFGRLTLSPDGSIYEHNSLFTQWVNSYQLPTPIKHWSQYFTPLNWPRVLHNTQHKLPTQVELISLAIDLTEETSSSFCVFGFEQGDNRILYLAPTTAYQALMAASNIRPALTQHTYSITGLETLFTQLQQKLQHSSSTQANYAAYIKIQYRYPQPNKLQETNFPINDAIHHYLNQQYRTPYYVSRVTNQEYLLIITQLNESQAQNSLNDLAYHLQRSSLTQSRSKQKALCHIGLIELSHTQSLSEVLSLAHSACEEAAQLNRTVTLYRRQSPEFNQHRTKLQFFKLLHQGKTDGLYLLMQPIINLKSPKKHYHAEVLLRYKNQHNKHLPTQNLISAAEQNGTIMHIDKWVIQTTLQWLSTHRQILCHLKCLHLNLSGVSLNDAQFISELYDLLDRYHLVLPKVCIEITESIALADLSYSRELMKNLQSRGVRIALDDFGAGYTSFSYLRELPANALKIDGSLIKDMLKTPSNTAIVRTIVELAQNLGMLSIAEWVEDAETLVELRKMGVDYVQGFAISKAIDPEYILQHKNILPLVENPLTVQRLR